MYLYKYVLSRIREDGEKREGKGRSKRGVVENELYGGKVEDRVKRIHKRRNSNAVFGNLLRITALHGHIPFLTDFSTWEKVCQLMSLFFIIFATTQL